MKHTTALSLCALSLVSFQIQAQRVSPPASQASTQRLGDPRTPIDSIRTPGDDDSVFRIEESGSYYLPSSLQGEAGKACIEVAASGVTIDLMGFSLQGVAGSLDGIQVVGSRVDLRITNGFVRSFDGDGLDLESVVGAHVQDVSARLNAGAGIRLGEGATALDCTVAINGLEGLRAGDLARIEGCLALNNGSEGIEAEAASIVRASISEGNAQDGIDLGRGSIVHNAVSCQNQGEGFFLGDGGLAEQSVALDGAQSGFSVGGGLVQGCSSKSNSRHGVFARGHTLVDENILSANEGDGVRVDFGASASKVHRNHAILNNVGFVSSTATDDPLFTSNTALLNAANFNFTGSTFFGTIVTSDSNSPTWSNVSR